jgi:hypothetical protein
VTAYKCDQPIVVIKIILTEIEGVLSDAYHEKMGARAKIRTLLKFARDSAAEKSGSQDTLLFPLAFAEYLQKFAYSDFDPDAGAVDAASRHAVGHGAAIAGSYTKVRALQALLTLDQFAFYI